MADLSSALDFGKAFVLLSLAPMVARWLTEQLHSRWYSEAQRRTSSYRRVHQLHCSLVLVGLLSLQAAYSVWLTVEAQPRNAYNLMNVPVTVSGDELRTTYKRLSMQVHPDKNPTAAANTAYMQLRDAYELISAPLKRQVHDLLGANTLTLCAGKCVTYSDYVAAFMPLMWVGYAAQLGMLLFMVWLGGQTHSLLWGMLYFAYVLSVDLTAVVLEADALGFVSWVLPDFTVRGKIQILQAIIAPVIMIFGHLHLAVSPQDAVQTSNALIELDLTLEQQRDKIEKVTGLGFRMVPEDHHGPTPAAPVQPTAPPPAASTTTTQPPQQQSQQQQQAQQRKPKPKATATVS